MNAAASSGNGGFGFGGQSTNEGYAIPIEDALAIGKKIESGDGGDTIHVGAHAAIMGVQVSDNQTSNGYGDPTGGNGDFGGPADQGSTTGNGAYVEDVQSGSGADDGRHRAGRHDRRRRRHEGHVGQPAHPPDGSLPARRQGAGRVGRLGGPEPHRHDRARVQQPQLIPAG